MSIGFIIKDVIHKITVRYFRAFLPNAAKPYNLRVVHQPTIDVHGIASKATVFNISTNPKVIEDGLNAGFQIMYYLAAEGYKIKTPLFNLKMSIPGEYSGVENRLPEGVFPVAKLRPSSGFRKYLKENVKLDFDGIETSEGIIAKARDEASGLVDELMTRGNILTINGTGLKVSGTGDRRDSIGVFFVPETGERIKASFIALNCPRTLMVLVPNELTKGESYHLAVETQSSIKRGSTLLKKSRSIVSPFTLKAA